MGDDDDALETTERQLDKWEKRFFFCVFAAFATLAIQLVFEADWLDLLDWLRGAAWIGAGLSSIQLGRILRSIGRDGSGMLLRGLGCFCVAIIAVV